MNKQKAKKLMNKFDLINEKETLWIVMIEKYYDNDNDNENIFLLIYRNELLLV